jgi:phenylacetate-CoA ligase
MAKYMTKEELAQYQFNKLWAHLKHAYDNSPFYRRKYDEAGIKPEDIKSIDDFYQKVPFITKEEMIENQGKNPPFGDMLAVDRKKVNRYFFAPGPITIAFMKEDWDEVTESSAVAFRKIAGLGEEDVIDNTTAYEWVIAGLLIDEAAKKTGAAVIPGGTGMTDMHVNMARLMRTTALIGFPTFSLRIGERAKEMGIDPRKDLSIRVIAFVGEVFSEEDRKKLSEIFGAQLCEIYGTADLALVALECPYRGGMHLFDDCIFEIIDPETDKHVLPGERGEIVATELIRKAMPVIRYRTHDLTEGLNLEPCPCGNPAPRLKRILGRVGDIPKVKGLFISPREITGVLTRYPELGRFQMIIERPVRADELTIRVEYKKPVAIKDMKARLVSEFKEAIRIVTEVDLVPEGTIPEGAKLVDDRRIV